MAIDCEVKVGEIKLYGQLNSDKGILNWDAEKVVNWDADQVVHDLKRIQREAKQATQSVRSLQLAQESTNKNEIDQLLKLAGKYGFLLTATTHDKSRGIGKTHSLVKKAVEEDLIILVANNTQVDYMSREFSFTNAVTPRNFRGIRGKGFNGFLVDDMVSFEDIEKFMDYFPHLRLCGGFITDSTTIKLGNLQLEKEY